MPRPTARQALQRNVDRGEDAALALGLTELLDEMASLREEVRRLGLRLDEVNNRVADSPGERR